MSKLFKSLVAAMLTIGLALSLCACGEDTASSKAAASSAPASASSETPASSTAPASSAAASQAAGGSAFPEALANVEAIVVPTIDFTGWELSGGLIDGVEMERADVDSMLKAMNGTMQFVFQEKGKVSLVTGDKTYAGTYEVREENYALFMELETGDTYWAAFTLVNQQPVMIAVNTKTSATALYFSPLFEG